MTKTIIQDENENIDNQNLLELFEEFKYKLDDILPNNYSATYFYLVEHTLRQVNKFINKTKKVEYEYEE